jgi:hypothetical protein
MKILVCGGREYNNKAKVFDVLHDLCMRYSENYDLIDNWLPTDILIISGEASGADTLAADFALVHCTQYRGYPADWNKHGRSAGYIRNQKMLNEEHPDLVVAFPGGRGTANMIEIARKAGVKVMEIKDD